MGKRDDFVKSIDARDYIDKKIDKSVREETEQLKKLTKIFDDWGKALCDKSKEELNTEGR